MKSMKVLIKFRRIGTKPADQVQEDLASPKLQVTALEYLYFLLEPAGLTGMS